MLRAGMSDRAQDPEERAFLERYDPSAYERPSVAVDVALLTVHEGRLLALVIERGEYPEKGRWALPGGFVGIEESLDDAARRVLGQKVGGFDVFLEQLYTFGAPDRDPRTRVVSVAYYALVDYASLDSSGGPGQLVPIEVPWDGEAGGPVFLEEGELAFDHDEILGVVVQRMRGKLDYAALGFQLLPAEFTLRDLQAVHEAVLGRPLNKDSFRRRMLASGRLEPTGKREQDVLHRPAELYRIGKASAI